jgi:hypothetical protein
MPVSVPIGSLEKQQYVMIQGCLELESSKQLVRVVVFEKNINISSPLSSTITISLLFRKLPLKPILSIA